MYSKENVIKNLLKKGKLFMPDGIDRVNNTYMYSISGRNIETTNYKKFYIKIDNVYFLAYGLGDFKRGYLGYYTLSLNEDMSDMIKSKHKINFDFIFQIYVPNDIVLDGESFYTTDIIERRILKIENIKNKIQNTK
jgi:hypothetical protein